MKVPSIRRQIIYITTLFSLIMIIVTVVVLSIFTQGQIKQNDLKSAEYNIDLINREIKANITNLNLLALWCSINSNVKAVIETEEDYNWVYSFDNLKNTIQNNPSYSYLDRIIITNTSFTAFMQYGPAVSESRQLNSNLLKKEIPPVKIEFSPLTPSSIRYDGALISSKLIELLNYDNNNAVIGYVYISLAIDKLFSNLYQYAQSSTSSIYVKIAEDTFRIEDSHLVLVDESIIKTDSCASVRIEDSNITILEEIAKPLGMIASAYIFLFEIIILCIVIFCILLAIRLDKLINRPLNKLSKKLEAISCSDFSIDKTIEGEDEFGRIGKVINTLSENIVILMKQRVFDEKKKQELNYKMLQSQINPHFLYNTLNAIKWMAVIQKATGISEMVTALSRLFKIISKQDKPLISIEDEFSFLKEYATIMRYRYGSDISIIFSLSEDVKEECIPAFTLQPFVENAIFHGLEPKATGAVIIKSQKIRDKVVLTVTDNGIGFDTSKPQIKKDGNMFKDLGISNVKERLYYFFKEDASLFINSKVGYYTQCIIKLPLNFKEKV